jgi:hypothetical protein
MNDITSELINKLLASDAAYKAFVKTTKSYQLAAQGVRESVNQSEVQKS